MFLKKPKFGPRMAYSFEYTNADFHIRIRKGSLLAFVLRILLYRIVTKRNIREQRRISVNWLNDYCQNEGLPMKLIISFE
jgi:hypothetical protein